MKQILKHTNFTEHTYNDMILRTYLTCCSQLAKSPQHLQLLLINQALNKWFLIEVTKINKDFLKTITPYKSIENKARTITYKSFLKRIYNNYPSVLINQIKINKKQPSLLSCN